MPEHPATGQRSAERWLTYLEYVLWFVAIAGALAFVAVKLRNWEPIPEMEQTDYAVYYQAAVASRIDPTSLFHIERWPALTGLDLPIVGPFPYTPTLVLLFWPLSELPYAQSQQVWLLLNVLLVLATFLILWRGAVNRRLGLLGALLWLILPGNFDTVYLGNNSLILTLGITIGVWAYSRRSQWTQFWGGAAIGVAASLKYFPLGLLLMALWERRWRFGAGILLGFLLFIFIGLAIVGWAAYDEWARMLLHYGTEFAPPGGGVIENQSIFGFWQKFAYAGDLGLSVHEVPLGQVSFQTLLDAQVARGLAVATALLVGGTTLYALWRMKRRDELAVTVAWTLVLLNMVMISPVSWKPYVAIIAPVYPALLLMRGHLSPGWRLLLPFGYILVIAQRGHVYWLPYVPIFALTSVMLFAYLAWWLFAMRLAWRLQDAAVERST
jgi:hypothetical protein